MRTVYKYPLPFADVVTVQMPRGAAILHVGVQHGHLCAWAMVDPGASPVPRRLRIAGTGHPVNCAAGEHVGTTMEAEGALVWHVFDLGEGDADV